MPRIIHPAVIFRRTIAVPWDDLDVQACADDGQPDWTTLTVTGPTKRRGIRGHTTLEWTVTVQCRPTDVPVHTDEHTWRTTC